MFRTFGNSVDHFDFGLLQKICNRHAASNPSTSRRHFSLSSRDNEDNVSSTTFQPPETKIWELLAQLAALEGVFFCEESLFFRVEASLKRDTAGAPTMAANLLESYLALWEKLGQIILGITGMKQSNDIDKQDLRCLQKILESRLFVLRSLQGLSTVDSVHGYVASSEIDNYSDCCELRGTRWFQMSLLESLILARLILASEAVEDYNFKDLASNLFLAKHLLDSKMMSEPISNKSPLPIHRWLHEYFCFIKSRSALIFDGPLRLHEQIDEKKAVPSDAQSSTFAERIHRAVKATGALHAGLVYSVDESVRFNPNGYASKVLPYQTPIGLQSFPIIYQTSLEDKDMSLHLPNIISIMSLSRSSTLNAGVHRFFDKKLKITFFLAKIARRITFITIYGDPVNASPALLSLIDQLTRPPGLVGVTVAVTPAR